MHYLSIINMVDNVMIYVIMAICSFFMTTWYGSDEFYFVSGHPMLHQGIFPYEIHRIKDWQYNVLRKSDNRWRIFILFKVTNNTDATYLSGRVWKEFIRFYGLEVGQEIYFTIGDNGPDTLVTTGNYPKFHPSKICTT